MMHLTHHKNNSLFRENFMDQKRKMSTGVGIRFFFLGFVFLSLIGSHLEAAKSLSIPAKKWGICFGNSAHFTGLRFNVIDNNTEIINGINLTLWKPDDKKTTGIVNGFSLGVLPYARELNGIQIGLLGPGAKENIRGINIGLIGSGSGEDMIGFNFGGIGIGSGNNLVGINIGLIGAGCGENMFGINIGGVGLGSGNNLMGFNFGGLGVGAGEKVMGITIAGLGAGAGDQLVGLTVAGLGAGAPVVKGLTIAGFGVGGKNIYGVSLSPGMVHITDDGVYTGLAISAFNYIKGTQKGVAIGIVNYAYRLKGLQIGLVNIVRDNPRGRVLLPIINFNF
jgi:hypothetical protein